MRTLANHKVNPANDKLEIEVLDEPGAGGASHFYRIKGFDGSTNDSISNRNQLAAYGHSCTIVFQNGPIPEKGVNGVTQEALLAVIEDRLLCFQDGPFANEYNQRALDHVRAAMAELQARTKERMERGVEGTHQQ